MKKLGYIYMEKKRGNSTKEKAMKKISQCLTI